MARHRSLVLHASIDQAQRSHKCQHSVRHVLQAGDVRLAVTANRTTEHFCRACAIEMVKADILRLSLLLEQLSSD